MANSTTPFLNHCSVLLLLQLLVHHVSLVSSIAATVKDASCCNGDVTETTTASCRISLTRWTVRKPPIAVPISSSVVTDSVNRKVGSVMELMTVLMVQTKNTVVRKTTKVNKNLFLPYWQIFMLGCLWLKTQASRNITDYFCSNFCRFFFL